MELLRGESLYTISKANASAKPAFSLPQALEILRQVLLAL